MPTRSCRRAGIALCSGRRRPSCAERIAAAVLQNVQGHCEHVDWQALLFAEGPVNDLVQRGLLHTLLIPCLCLRRLREHPSCKACMASARPSSARSRSCTRQMRTSPPRRRSSDAWAAGCPSEPPLLQSVLTHFNPTTGTSSTRAAHAPGEGGTSHSRCCTRRRMMTRCPQHRNAAPGALLSSPLSRSGAGCVFGQAAALVAEAAPGTFTAAPAADLPWRQQGSNRIEQQSMRYKKHPFWQKLHRAD